MAKFQVGVDFTQDQVDKASKIVDLLRGIATELGAPEVEKLTAEISAFVDSMQKALDEEARLNTE